MSGYVNCACGGCFEIVCGEEGDYCHECREAQCDSYDEHGMKGETECLVDPCKACGAYNEDCKGCEHGPGDDPVAWMTKGHKGEPKAVKVTT